MSAACCIDHCPHPAFYRVAGYPDATDLCTEHIWTACECMDESYSSQWCPLHGDDDNRSRCEPPAFRPITTAGPVGTPGDAQ